MDAKELRIDSLVFDEENSIVKIESIFKSTFKCFAHSLNDEILMEFKLNKLNPIPLTEEWLLKFGFENDSITISRGLIMLSPNSKWNMYAVWYRTLTHGKIDIMIKYVHQLQNLYFCLTGEELTIPD